MSVVRILFAAAGLAAVGVLPFLVPGARPPQEPPAPAAPPLPREFLPVADVRAGMKGYGLSVFSGTKIERFDVEVVSVLRKFYGDKDIILIRVGHPVTDHANVIAGMSGSPIYLEGRLAGALALGFSAFAKDPLAGVTPIEYMLADKAHPTEDENAFRRPLPPDSPFEYVRTPLFASGLPPAALADLKAFAEPFGMSVLAGSAGGGQAAEEARIEPGAAVGVAFLRGDIALDGVGTVTHVDGKDVLVFGHSMLMGGRIELPMTTAYVHTVIASQYFSFKLASAGRPVGTMLQDRLTSVYGVLDQPAPMIPFSVEVENPRTQFRKTFRFEVGRHPLYTPFLLTRVPEYCLQLAEAGQMKDQTVRYEMRLKLEGHPPLEIRDAYVSSPTEMGDRGLASAVFQLFGNPFRRVRPERVEVKMSVVHRRASAAVDAVWLQAPAVKPGETLRLTVRLRPYDREPFRETLEVPVPSSLPDGEYELSVMGGREADAPLDMQSLMQAILSGRMPVGGDAQSFEELLQQIRRRAPAHRLLARLELPGLGVRYKDRKLENLPGSVFVNLVSNPSAGIRLERDRLEVGRDTEWVIEGKKTVRFEVRTPGQRKPDAEK